MRGVGKSTWAAEHFSEAVRVDLLRESVFQSHLANANLFRETLAPLPRGSWVVVDEVQRLPSLLNEVHSLVEEKRLRFLLLGSSARKLRRAGVNLLGGRALRTHLDPLLPTELGTDFSLEGTLRHGSLPLVLNASNRESQLDAYVEMYLKEEIHAEALVRNLPGFSRFLKVAGLFHGQVLSVETLARDAGVARTTIQGFLDILEDTLVARRLPAFEGRLRVKEKRHPKLYWLDSGLVRAARRHTGPIGVDERGALFEGLLAQWLWSYQNLGWLDFDDLWYWGVGGTKQVEVDFLLERRGEFVAIEAKAVERLRPEHLSGLKAIETLKGLRRRILVYLGDETRLADGIEMIPVSHFIECIAQRRLLT